jgi:hypothetical protein
MCHLKCKWMIYYLESEDENCGNSVWREWVEDLEDFDQFKECNFIDLNGFSNVYIFAQIRLWITRNKKSVCYIGRILEHKDDDEFQVCWLKVRTWVGIFYSPKGNITSMPSSLCMFWQSLLCKVYPNDKSHFTCGISFLVVINYKGEYVKTAWVFIMLCKVFIFPGFYRTDILLYFSSSICTWLIVLVSWAWGTANILTIPYLK